MEKKSELVRVDMEGRQMRSIIKTMRKLELYNIGELLLGHNYLRKIEPIIEECINLNTLDLTRNNIIENIESLSSLQTLQQLLLSNNQISVIENLESLRSLKLLDLSANKIVKLQGLRLPQLEVLKIYGNQISRLEGLDDLPALQVLEINKNEIPNIEYLATAMLPNLKVFNFSCNLVDNLDSAAYTLASVKSLSVIDGYGNPIESDFRYRFKLAENPSIMEIDGMTLTTTVRKELDQMREQNDIDTLIKSTSEQYSKRIDNEKQRKELALKYIKRHEEQVKNKFEQYRDDMNKELSEFIGYVNFVRRKRDQGEEIEITPEFLSSWKSKLMNYEADRKSEEEKAKRDIEDRYNSLILTQLINTTYSDKLYEIAMTKPELWKSLKRKEYDKKIKEDQDVARDQINMKYRMLTQGLEKEDYLNRIIDGGQSRVFGNVQADLQGPAQSRDVFPPPRSASNHSVQPIPEEPEEKPEEKKLQTERKEEPPEVPKSRGCVIF